MGHGHSHDHVHAIPGAQNERALLWAFGLTFAFMLVEVIGGAIADSLALISDAAHMFTDTAALAIALAAIRVGKRAADAKRTFGYQRFEILAAAFNALLLFGVAAYIVYEAYERFRNPVPIASGAMMAIAAIGLLVNLTSMRILAGGRHESLNVKGAYLEVWSDMLGSVGVLVGGLLILLTGWNWVDPVIAVGIGFWVLPRTWVLLRDSINILLEGVPEGIDVDKVNAEMLAVAGVTGVHDLHIWALTSGKPSLTAHVVHESRVSAETDIVPRLQERLQSHFSIRHTTFQCETVPCVHAEDGCNFSPTGAGAAGFVPQEGSASATRDLDPRDGSHNHHDRHGH